MVERIKNISTKTIRSISLFIMAMFIIFTAWQAHDNGVMADQRYEQREHRIDQMINNQNTMMVEQQRVKTEKAASK